MKSWITLCLCIILLGNDLYSQSISHHFQSKALGKLIGTIYVNRETKGNEVIYKHNSSMSVNLLIKRIELQTYNEVHYLDGQLMSVKGHALVNGEIHTSSEIKWEGTYYTITIDGEAQPPLKEPIYFSGSMLYYEEPIGVTKVFAEASGLFMKVKALGDAVYQVTDPRTNRNMIRYYEDGLLVLTKLKHPLLTIHMPRVEQDG